MVLSLFFRSIAVHTQGAGDNVVGDVLGGAVDVVTEETTRIVGVYASECRSWKWEQISPFITNNCILFGVFNVDLELDALIKLLDDERSLAFIISVV